MTARQAKIKALSVLGNMTGTGIYEDKVMKAIDVIQNEMKSRCAKLQKSEEKAAKKKAKKAGYR
jgi:hypothetical protein